MKKNLLIFILTGSLLFNQHCCANEIMVSVNGGGINIVEKINDVTYDTLFDDDVNMYTSPIICKILNKLEDYMSKLDVSFLTIHEDDINYLKIKNLSSTLYNMYYLKNTQKELDIEEVCKREHICENLLLVLSVELLKNNFYIR